jgi:hypothetical protein
MKSGIKWFYSGISFGGNFDSNFEIKTIYGQLIYRLLKNNKELGNDS